MTDPDTLITIFNFLRGVSVCLYGIVLGQIGYIVNHYFKIIRIEKRMGLPKNGLLPSYVMYLTSAYLLAVTECVIQNVQRIGDYPNYFAYANPVMMSLSVIGFGLLMKFEYVRYTRTIDPGIKDLIEI